MQRLFALIFAIVLWFSCVPSSLALGADLVPCNESPAFQQRAASARNTTADPNSGQKRFERYSQALCGPEGLPHLIVDGRLERAGDFSHSQYPISLYRWLDWLGRSRLLNRCPQRI